MALKDNAGTVVSITNYIFEDAGNAGDQLEQTLLREFEAKRFPGKYTIETERLGAAKYSSVQIAIDSNYQVRVYHLSIGTYLYVRIYLYMPNSMTNALSKALNSNQQVTRDFQGSKYELVRDATYSAVVAVCEEAFAKLSLKTMNTGYRPIKSE